MYERAKSILSSRTFVSTRVQSTIFRCPVHVKWIVRSKQGRKFACAWCCTTLSTRTKWLDLVAPTNKLQSAKVPQTLACLPTVPQSPSMSSALSTVRGRLVYSEELFCEVVPGMTPNIEIMQSTQHDDDPSTVQGKIQTHHLTGNRKTINEEQIIITK